MELGVALGLGMVPTLSAALILALAATLDPGLALGAG